MVDFILTFNIKMKILKSYFHIFIGITTFGF